MRRALLDENITRDIAAALTSAGWSVTRMSVTGPGSPDQDVLALSVRSRSVLITRDSDYGQLIFRDGQAAYGVVYLRTHYALAIEDQVAAAAGRAVGRYITLDDGGERDRPLPGDET